MKVGVYVCVVVFLMNMMNSVMSQQVGTGIGLGGFCAIVTLLAVAAQHQECEEDKEEAQEEFYRTVCRKRSSNEANCLRCLNAHGTDEEECNADIGSNGVNDAAGAAGNDDCAFDPLGTCLDENV